MSISPQGYIYGKEPYSENPFWNDDPLVQTELTATASVDDTTGTPSVDVTRTEETEPVKKVNFNFAFSGLKGEKGDTGEQGEQGEQGTPGTDGVTPEITASATVDDTTGTPSVSVVRTGTDAMPHFGFSFSGIKGETGAQGAQGEKGDKGDTGDTGAQGAKGDKGDPGESVEAYIASYPESGALSDHSGILTDLRGVDYRNAQTDMRAYMRMTLKDSNDVSQQQDFGIVPAGGSAGDVLTKVDGSDFHTKWVTPQSGGGGMTQYKLSDLIDNGVLDLRVGDIVEISLSDYLGSSFVSDARGYDISMVAGSAPTIGNVFDNRSVSMQEGGCAYAVVNNVDIMQGDAAYFYGVIPAAVTLALGMDWFRVNFSVHVNIGGGQRTGCILRTSATVINELVSVSYPTDFRAVAVTINQFLQLISAGGVVNDNVIKIYRAG